MNLLGTSRQFSLERGPLGGSLHGLLAAAAPTRAANSEKHARHADTNLITVGSFANAASSGRDPVGLAHRRPRDRFAGPYGS